MSPRIFRKSFGNSRLYWTRTCGRAYEIIVVDDDSPDGTWALALELSKQYPTLRVMRRQTERGLATAVIRGWQAARGQLCWP